MKKRMNLVMVIVLLALLVGCGDEEDSTKANNNGDNNEEECECQITGNSPAKDRCCDGCHLLPDGTKCFGHIFDAIMYLCLEEGKCGGGYVSIYPEEGAACYNGVCGGGIVYCPLDSKCKSGASSYKPPCGLPCVPSEECGAIIDGDEDEEYECPSFW